MYVIFNLAFCSTGVVDSTSLYLAFLRNSFGPYLTLAFRSDVYSVLCEI